MRITLPKLSPVALAELQRHGAGDGFDHYVERTLEEIADSEPLILPLYREQEIRALVRMARDDIMAGRLDDALASLDAIRQALGVQRRIQREQIEPGTDLGPIPY